MDLIARWGLLLGNGSFELPTLKVGGENCQWQFGQPEALRGLAATRAEAGSRVREAKLVTESPPLPSTDIKLI